MVDDSSPFREATRELIDATSGFEWIGDASCGEEGVEESARLEPDLVLMDVRMPGIGGVEAARRIVARPPAPMVVLITCSDLSSVPDRGGVELLAKDRLTPASLRRVWQEHVAGPT